MFKFKREKTSESGFWGWRLMPVTVFLLLLISYEAVSAQTVNNPGLWIPPVVNLKSAGFAGESKQFLSVSADGNLADLYNKDDSSGRQQWIFRRSSDGVSYNIMVGGGTPFNRKFLSVTPDGSRVDLYGTDDGSGRQRWTVIEGSDGKLTILIRGGVTNARKYLSVTSDGSKVDLFDRDDNSGRQRWNLVVPRGATFNLRISGGVAANKTVLSTYQTYSTVFLSSAGGDSFQAWSISRVDKE